MVQINFAQKQVNAKVVYYGPGMSGKTTNLEIVHQRAPEPNRGELTSISTDGDRTLFFDFMPLDLGTVAGMRTCFQIYTVPGQVYYNSTRKLVLQGVDGVVFVADSSAAMMDENLESLRNLEENLREYGKDVAELPIVIQYNKRDLPDAMSVEDLNARINPEGRPYYEAVANSGKGVFPTLKALAAQVLESIHKNYGSGGGSSSAAAPASSAAMPSAPQTPTSPPVASGSTGFYAAPPQPAAQETAMPQMPQMPTPPAAAAPQAPAAQAPMPPAPQETLSMQGQGGMPMQPMGEATPPQPPTMAGGPGATLPGPGGADPLARTTIHPPPGSTGMPEQPMAQQQMPQMAPQQDTGLRLAMEPAPAQQQHQPMETTQPVHMMGVSEHETAPPAKPPARSFPAGTAKPKSGSSESPRFKPRAGGSATPSKGGGKSVMLTGIFVVLALAAGAVLGSFVLSMF